MQSEGIPQMFRTASQLHRLVIVATDGEIGSIDRLFFDDLEWTIRHLVIDTGKWLPGRKVLIAPASVTAINDDGGRASVNLTRDRVRDSPDVDTEKPVSRQKELELARFYGYVPYWGTGGVWGGSYYPAAAVSPPFGMLDTPMARAGAARDLEEVPQDNSDDSPEPEGSGDPHLRSTRELKGYHVQATDGAIGHVDDFVVHAESWKITHLVLDTSNWPGGRAVVIPASWVSGVAWETMKIRLDASVATVRERPEQTSPGAIDRELEGRLLQDLKRDPTN